MNPPKVIDEDYIYFIIEAKAAMFDRTRLSAEDPAPRSIISGFASEHLYELKVIVIGKESTGLKTEQILFGMTLDAYLANPRYLLFPTA